MPQATTPEHEHQVGPTPCREPEQRRGRAARRMGLGVVLGKRLRRRTRWLLRGAVFLPLLSVLAVLLLMRSPAVGWVAGRQLEAALGCTARAQGSFITYDGRIVLRGVSLRVPGMSGPEGEFLSVERVEIDADWSRVFSGGVKPIGVRLYRPVFRISASEAQSELNLQGLHPTRPDAMAGDKPVRIDVVSGALELGEHTASSYRVLRAIGISGELIPSEKEPGLYTVRFREIAPPGTAPAPAGNVGMVLSGRVDLRSSIAVMDLLNVDLNAWQPSSVPKSMRAVWEQLNIKGRIASTALEYFPTTGLTALIRLEDVSMDAIVPADYPAAGVSADVLSLRNVHGKISLSRAGLDADVAGMVENQTYQSRVILKTRELTTVAALECKVISRGFKVEKDSALLPFCPPVVRERLANFCGPTAVVDADVIIRRDSPGPEGPAPFKVAGWLTFEHGTAAFDRVPYPFTEMQGRVEFDDNGIDILRIRGVGPDGAALTAKGRIAPPNDEAAVDVEVKVKNVPLDETFMSSLPPSRAEAIDFLFNRARYAELLAAGLVRGEKETGTVPAFTPGGRMDLEVSVHSPPGKDAPWHYTVDAVIPEAGVLTRAFPLPIAARNVRLQLTEREAKLIAGEFRGLTGGTTGVNAKVVLEVDGAPVIRPEVTIDAHGVPIDALLLHAIEHASGPAKNGAEPGAIPSPAELLRTLRLTGDVDCRAEITSAPEETINFDIGVSFDELEARPAREGTEPLLGLTDIAGSIRLTNTSVKVPELTAGIRALEGAAAVAPQLAPGADLGWLSCTLSGRLQGIDTSLTPEKNEPRKSASIKDLHAGLDLSGLELAAPLEESLAAFSPAIADRFAELRNLRQPTGRVSATVEVTDSAEGGTLDATARVTAAENVGFNAAGERLDFSLGAGTIVIDSRHTDVVTFDGAAIEIGIGDLSRAPLRIDGKLLLEAGADADGARESRLSVTGKDIPVESPAVTLVLRQIISAEDVTVIKEANPTGRFDATVEIPSTAFVDETGDSLKGVTAVIVPKSLGFDFEGSRVLLKSFEGRLTVGAGGIGLERLVAHADDWTAGLDGRWERGTDAPGLFEAELNIAAESLSPGIRALLPTGLREQLDRMELKINGPIRCDGARIEYRTGAADSSVVGELRFSGASLDIGAPVSEAEGVLSLRALRAAGAPAWSFGLDLNADRIVAMGLEMSGLESRITVGAKPGELLLEHLSADCYAGRLTARARVVDSAPEAPRTKEGKPHSGAAYDAEITLAGVCFAPVLAALDAARVRSEGGATEPMTTEMSTDPRRGRLDGTLAIRGTVGEAAHRSGVGSVRIAGGDVIEMPLVLTLVQLSNFQIPSSDRLDFLQAMFHVNRNLVVFDQIDLLSSKVTISGRGTMTWPDQELDLRFNSRAGQRVPLFSALFETVRDEIATTRIRGTLSQPQVGPEPLLGTRELIGNIVGERPGQRPASGLPDSRTERDRYHELRPQAPTRKPHESSSPLNQ